MIPIPIGTFVPQVQSCELARAAEYALGLRMGFWSCSPVGRRLNRRALDNPKGWIRAATILSVLRETSAFSAVQAFASPQRTLRKAAEIAGMTYLIST